MNTRWLEFARPHAGKLGGAAWFLGCALLAGSEGWVQQQEQQAASVQAAYRSAQQQLQAAQQAQATLQTDLPEYRLQQRHVLMTPPPEDWLESAAQLQTVTAFSHVLAAPQLSDGPTAQWQAVSMPMQLTLEVPHELPLLAFFEAMAQQPYGWFQLDGCVLRRVETGLQASCRGRWLALQPRGKT